MVGTAITGLLVEAEVEDILAAEAVEAAVMAMAIGAAAVAADRHFWRAQ